MKSVITNKKLKKAISFILILTMLIIPFTGLLSVKAVAVDIATDDTKTLEGNTAFKYVTNTTELFLRYVDESDTFSAYKVLDIYYNKNTNELSYGFTQNFQTFLNQLDSSDEFANYTVEKYQQLTSDDPDAVGDIVTTSTLNKLVSKYATYTKKNNITGLPFTKDATSTNIIENIEVGAYLILPTSVVSETTYGVLVSNIMFTVNDKGAWDLSATFVNSKAFSKVFASSILSESDDEMYDDITYTLGNKIYYGVAQEERTHTIPTNTHSSILNNESIMNLLAMTEITFPTGVTYNTSNMYLFDEHASEGSQKIPLEMKNNALYYTSEGTEYKYADIEISEDSSKMTISNFTINAILLYIEIGINDNIATGTSASNIENSTNTIITKEYYLKDPYADIGTNPTQNDIDKAIEMVSMTNTIYTYGVTVTNKGNNEVLNGSKFQICTDKACTSTVGKEFEITENGTYTFKGINDTDTYYLKQIKAPTGYKLLSEPIELNPTSLNKEVGLYSVEVNNNKQGLLPSTGGLGTVFYTLIGLLVIGAGSYSIIRYSKKQVNS